MFISDVSSSGRERIDLAAARMPVLRSAAATVLEAGSLRGARLAVAIHITTETAVLVEALVEAGAEHVALCSSNWRTSSQDVCDTLHASDTISLHGRTEEEVDFASAFHSVLNTDPHYLIDDGAELITLSHQQDPLGGRIRGALEETTSGVRRVKALEQDLRLRYPVVAINNARTKHYFDNRYGTGQSAVDAVMRCTNLLFAGTEVAVVGYGRCGRGIARAAAGLGAKVSISEVDPVAALEAHYDGFEVGPAVDVCSTADVVFTATGSLHVVNGTIWERARPDTLFVNCGHFRNELDMGHLESIAQRHEVRPGLHRYTSRRGVSVFVLAEGNIANLSAAEGNPATLMDMSFSNQILGLQWLVEQAPSEASVLPLPNAIDEQVAQRKLESVGIEIDRSTAAQQSFNMSAQ